MRKMKRFLSMVLVIVLTLALAVPVLADVPTTGSITIRNAVEGQTYRAYRLFDLSLDAGAAHYGYTLSAEWKDFFTTGDGQSYVSIDPANGNVSLVKTTADDLQKLAQAAKTYAEAQSLTGLTPTGTAPELKFENVELGYYLITSDAGALQALDTTDRDVIVYEKNTAPEVGKTADKTNAAIGEIVHFTITVTKGGYAWGDYVINDTMTGLVLKPETVKVKANGTDLAAEAYSKTIETTTNTKLTVTIPEKTLNLRTGDDTDFLYPAGTKFVVEYDAVANKTVEMDNTVSMDYHTDPTTSKTTPSYVVKVANYEFSVKKTDEEGHPLEGATFELHRQADCADAAMEFVKTDNTYKLAGPNEAGAKVSVITAGQAKIEGLAAGIYYLKEVSAPDGYNKLVNPVKVEIIEHKNQNQGNPYFGQAFDDQGSRLAPTIKIDGQTDLAGDFVLTVINKTGTGLPSTGGIGTTIFYVVGGLLMIAAVAALLLKKRTSR